MLQRHVAHHLLHTVEGLTSCTFGHVTLEILSQPPVIIIIHHVAHHLPSSSSSVPPIQGLNVNVDKEGIDNDHDCPPPTIITILVINPLLINTHSPLSHEYEPAPKSLRILFSN